MQVLTSGLLDCTIIVPTTLYIGLSGVGLGECNTLHKEIIYL